MTQGHSYKTARQSCLGFTLIEVFVAFMILSYGLLALAYLQTRSVQFGKESQNRTQINAIVADMIDRMRMNQVSASDSGSSVYTTGVSTFNLANGPCVPEASSLNEDMVCFYRRLEAAVPTSNFQIDTVDLDGDSEKEGYRITVYWSDQQLIQGDLREDDEETLIKQADCMGPGRMWSSSLSWPDSERPDPKLCLLSHTWQFEVMAR